MASIHVHLQIIAWSLTLVLLSIAHLNPPLFISYIKIPTTILLITLLGIPHGAIDHLLYYQICRRNGQKYPLKWRFNFYGNYFAFMLLWTIGWLSFPALTLAAFLLMSSFHFGQVPSLNSSQARSRLPRSRSVFLRPISF
jgi:Brp/Blh family beta-carotene 15,15'-monooxygenase